MNINMDVNRTFLILNTGEVRYSLAKLPKVFKTNGRRTTIFQIFEMRICYHIVKQITKFLLSDVSAQIGHN